MFFLPSLFGCLISRLPCSNATDVETTADVASANEANGDEPEDFSVSPTQEDPDKELDEATVVPDNLFHKDAP